MVGKKTYRAQMFRGVRFVLAVAALAVPRLCLAQDTRTEPEFAPGAQGGGGGAVAGTTLTPIGGLFTEPRLISRSIHFAVDKFEGKDKKENGFYPEFSNMITGAGWVSVGPGYRHWLWNDKAYYDASAAVSWHLYTMGQTRIVAPDLGKHHVALGTQVMWQDQTQINFFGVGPDSLESQKSQYQLRSTDTVGWASVRPWESWTLGGEAGYLFSPHVSDPTGTFKPSVPTTIEEFPQVPGVSTPDQPNYIHAEAAFTGDTRDYRGHPTRGGLYRAAVEQFSDQDTGLFTFRQYQAEALQLIRLKGPDWVLGFHGWLVTSDVPTDHEVPFYFLPSLGGATTLRSFSNYRFHDQNLALVNAESRWAVFQHVDFAAFVDAGNVAGTFSDLNIDHTSVGVGLMLHAERTTFARLDVAHGSEGWHVYFRTSDLFRYARTTRRIVGIPFVP